MKVKYIGHACFLFVSVNGTRIVTDPYDHTAYEGAIRYEPVDEEADIVLVSHGHPDHNYTADIRGEPVIISSIGNQIVEDIEISGLGTYHDTTKGSERGSNIIFRAVVDGISICHLGDLGHILDDSSAEQIKPVDVLLMPVGGFFTIGTGESDEVIGTLAPKLVIPMHYKTESLDFPIAPVDDFLEGRGDVTRTGSSEAEFTKEKLPSGIMVLEPAAAP